MELTRRQLTNIEPGQFPARGPMNEFAHVRQFPPAEFRVVVRPNFDTLYSIVFLDLTDEPMIVTAPDTDGRYYMLPMMDMWTDVFAVPGQRTSGTGPGAWAVVPQGWQGELPDRVERIDAPTPYVWIIGRTQTNGPADYPAVHVVQDGFEVCPLSQWGQTPTPPTVVIDPAIDMRTPPLKQIRAMTGGDFFALGAELMKLHPPHLTDWSTVRRMRALGVVPGESFDPTSVPGAVATAIAAAPGSAQAALRKVQATMAVVTNGWQMNTNTMGVYGDFYDKRAIITMVGLGANPAEDAIYPLLMHDADGHDVDGSTNYVLHFDHDQLPPVDAFWSVTMYDAGGFPVANELDRYAIGDRDPLTYNADGSLDLSIQHTNPGPDRVSNWLPMPTGPVGITMRLYVPRPSALDGT